MQSFFDFNSQYPWALPTAFAVILLFGLFIRRRALAARATKAVRGEAVTVRELNRARIQFLMAIACVVLLFVIWLLQG